ncbi:S8 family peptidase [Noviherbaspirillum massiliense]|uniref:S8 family peptidase n=1 Tax=Noviherbaspirillum massiliense TaxID=1465823 RepID=UPI00031191FF|nr:S8 family serine peptidase [Noviherbaspirillum massiliense]
MFKLDCFRPSLMALALAAVFSIPVHADEAANSDIVVRPAQLYFPVDGAYDPEHVNSAATVTPLNADYAYAHRITGRGVTVAILDTGITAGHDEFREAGKLLRGFNTLNGSTDVTDYAGHGTHVAGIIGAARDGKGTFGLAFDAQLLPIKVLGDDGKGSTAYLDAGLRYAIGRASIVNMSLGAEARYSSAAMQEAVAAGMLIVAAAGNESAANPNWPARFAKESWANNQIIAVGAVDANKQIAPYSNLAGDTAQWYLVAPGTSILSSYLNGQYAYMSGTSMATPVVSGAAALIKQCWPRLSADQIANILFTTATDLGAPGIDAVYGRGLLNVEKALQPIGTLSTTAFDGSTVSILLGSARPSAATSQLWRLALSGRLRALGFDDYQRDYSVDLGQSVSRPPTLSVQDVFGSLDRRIEVAETVLPNGAQLMAAYEHALPVAGKGYGYGERSYADRLAAFSLVSQTADGAEAAFGIGGMAANYFGAGGLEIAQGLGLGMVSALSNPYFSLIPSAAHAAAAYSAGGIKIKFGMLSSGVNEMLQSQDVAYTPPGLPSTRPRADSALLELSQSFEHAALSMSFLQTSEKNAFLGSQSSGALALSPHATTSSVQLAGALLLTPHWALAGQAAFGSTPGSANPGSLIAEIGETRTNAFSLALVTSNRMAEGDRFSFALSQPMRTYSGRMVLDTVASVDGEGNAVRERVVLPMAPAGRELRAELNYQSPLDHDSSIGTTLMWRHEPNNLADAPPEALLALRYTRQF